MVFLLCLAWLPRKSFAQSGSPPGEGEEKIRQIEDSLAVLSRIIFTDTSSENRFAATRQFIPQMVRALQVENSFSYRFDRLPHISIQYPIDSTFRIFSWQLYVDDDTYRYYGALQMNRPDLQLFPFADRSSELSGLEDAELSPERWYGAVYYRLQQVDGPGGTYYLLFGFDGYEFFRNRKVLDVLHFDEAGQPVFGLPVLVHEGTDGAPDTTRSRLVLEYSAEASVRLNYDPALEMIIFDHLVTMPGQHGEGPVGLPDGSYEGYKLVDGRWVYVEKIWDEVSDEVPRPFPILDKRQGDLFGNH